PALLTPAGDPIRFKTKKHLALLVYLAVEPRTAHRRDRLADLLWGDAPISEARHSLATAVSVLRARLGRDAFDSTRDHVRLVTSSLDLDLDRLRSGDVLGDEANPPLEVAAFLDGLELPDAPEFCFWRDQQQATLLPAITAALVRQMDHCRRTGDFSAIEILADRMLGMDALNEAAIRAKMEARAFAGDRLSALRVYEDWERLLARDLRAAPSALLEGMALRLRRRGWERRNGENIPIVQTDHWKGRSFVGRAAEYRALYEGWERTRQGEPGHAFVMGDSGIGKSTLVARLITAAGLEGAATSRIQCYELEREIPYAALTGLVHGLLARAGVGATPPEALAEIARTVPEVRRHFPHLPPGRESEGETARVRLTEAFHEMVRAIAEEHPVILVIDDVHLADDASLSVLHLLMRRSRGESVMVILALRPAELNPELQAGRMLDRAEALGITRIELPPLTESESAAVIRAAVPGDVAPPSPTIRRALVQAAAGYPMVLELLVQDWMQHGTRCLAIALGAMTADPEAGGTGAYQPLIERLAQTLDLTTRNVLTLAAILGQRMNDLEMYRLVDLSTGQTMSGLTRLVDLRLLRDGGDGLEFANELIRGKAYLGVPSPVRRTLHRDIAGRLLHDEEDGKKVPGFEIAWHLIRGGLGSAATPYLLRGGREALRKGAPHETDRGLSSALPLLTGEERSEAILLLTEALQEQGQWRASLDALHTDGLHWSDDALLLQVTAESATNASIDQTRAQLGVVLDVLQHANSRRTRLQAASIAARLINGLRDPIEASDVLRAVAEADVSAEDDEGQAKLALAQSQLYFHTGDRAASLRMLDEARAQLASGEIMSSTAVRLHFGIGTLETAAGRYESASKAFSVAYEMAAKLGNETACGRLAAQAALCSLRLGKYDEQFEWSSRATSTFGRSFSGYREVQTAYNLGLSHAILGEVVPAHMALEALDSRITESERPAWLLHAWQLYKADVLYVASRRADARRAAHAAVTVPADSVVRSFMGPYARWLGAIGSDHLGEELVTERLLGMYGMLDKFDVLDQAEILTALLLRPVIADETREEAAARLQATRAGLPHAALYQLELLTT
ncbi:MAG TPA: AAA family ATPase, partial [Gemmatimonadales bacterium]|nr:AAA family ATPase [Gemmatimonadales bacterium]